MTKLLAAAAIAAGLAAAQEPTARRHDEAAGVLVFVDAKPAGKVWLDGELAGTLQQLKQFGERFFVATGDYDVVIGESLETGCRTRISVRAGEKTFVRCGIATGGELASARPRR